MTAQTNFLYIGDKMSTNKIVFAAAFSVLSGIAVASPSFAQSGETTSASTTSSETTSASTISGETQSVEAQSGEMEFAPKSLGISGAVGLTLNPTAQLPDEGEVRVQGNYFDFGKVKNPTANEELSFAKISGPPAPGFTFDENVGEFKYYGAFAAARAGKRLEVSGGIAHQSAKGGVLFSQFNPLIILDEGLALSKISVPSSGSGIFVNIDYPDLDKTGFALGAKYLLRPAKTADDFAVAVGAGFNTALTDNVHAYIVASKGLTNGKRAIKAHIGARYDRYQLKANRTQVEYFNGDITSIDTRTFRARSNKASAFIGAEIPLDSKGNFSVIGEYQTRNTDTSGPDSSFFGDGSSPYSISLRYAKNQINASIGTQRQGIIRDSGLFAQVGYAF